MKDINARLRLISGLILLFYVFTHLLNHSIGIFGLETLERARLLFIGFWRNPFINWILIFSLLVHLVLVLRKLFFKKTYKGLKTGEWWQIVLGLFIPLILATHYYATKISSTYFQIADNYSYVILSSHPEDFFSLFLMLLIVWIHGMLGLHYYLYQKGWYARVRRGFDTITVALPILAFWGIVSAIKEISSLKQDLVWMSNIEEVSNPNHIDVYEHVMSFMIPFNLSYLVFLTGFFTARFGFLKFKSRKQAIRIRYLNGNAVTIMKGTSLLEASLQGNIPHAHVCGGRGRCSTCRVQVINGLNFLPPPSPDEKSLLDRIGTAHNVRLACQTRPFTDCTIHPILMPNATVFEATRSRKLAHGSDLEIAILFADLRGFTSFSEDKLPYDVVFVLNQYFQFMGGVIEANNGHIDKFIGDGIMALFGINDGIKSGCTNAVRAAKEMFHQLEKLNTELKYELKQPLKMGVGIHNGHVIVGEMGYKNHVSMTAVGSPVNIAARLEAATKEYGCQMIVSSDVLENTPFDFSNYPSFEINIRGRNTPLKIYKVDNVAEMV